VLGDFLRKVFRGLSPDQYLNSIFEIDFDDLKKRGIKALLLDVDNTLKPHYAKAPAANVRGWLDDARAAGLAMCIVSNGLQGRIEPFAHDLGLSAIGEAMKPSRKGFILAAKHLGFEIHETAVVGDQIFTDVIGGKLAGSFTILVKPISKDEPFYLRLKRPFEKLVLIRKKKL